MYGYSKYVPLNKEEILKRVSEKEIFSIFFNDDIVEDKGAYYTAPYRMDNSPGCYFERYEGSLFFVDFTMSPPVIDCFNMVCLVKKCTFTEALQFINNYFSLGLNGGNSKEEKYSLRKEEKPKKKDSRKTTIQFIPRAFNRKDLNYWGSYYITKENLNEDFVVPISFYRISTKKGKILNFNTLDLAYAYVDFRDFDGSKNENKVKIYRPFGDKSSKWATNCTQNDVGAIHKLPEKGKSLIITKSYKDYRVLTNLGLLCIYFQSERSIPSINILTEICKRFEKITVWFDNDSTGLAYGKFVKDVLNNIKPNIASYIFLPPKLLQEDNIKDPADMIHKKGKKELLDFILSKGLLEE